MARTNIPAGGTIIITDTLTSSVVSDFDNIKAIVYTSKVNIAQFSILDDGCSQPIEVLSDTQIKMRVLSENSKMFSGDLYYEIAAIKDNKSITLEHNGIGKIDTTITVDNNFIKDRI